MAINNSKNKLTAMLIKVKVDNSSKRSFLCDIETKVVQISRMLKSHEKTVESLVNAANYSHLLNQNQAEYTGKEVQIRSNWIAKANLLKSNCQSKATLVNKELQTEKEKKFLTNLQLQKGKSLEKKLRHSLDSIEKKISIMREDLINEDFIARSKVISF